MKSLAKFALVPFLVIAGPAGADTMVEIGTFQFKPKVIEVKPGTRVMWTNADAILHSVTAGTPAEPSAAFDSGFFDKGGSYGFTFETPGEYPYFCARHEHMRGVVRVLATE